MIKIPSPKILLTLLLLIAIAEVVRAMPTTGDGRFVATSKPREAMKCNEYPRVCRAKGSAGPDCCGKQCVNVMIDELNCGMCGKKCRYSEMCCQGRCVNPLVDEKNCGNCNHQCKKGSSCVYGLCSYA